MSEALLAPAGAARGSGARLKTFQAVRSRARSRRRVRALRATEPRGHEEKSGAPTRPQSGRPPWLRPRRTRACPSSRTSRARRRALHRAPRALGGRTREARHVNVPMTRCRATSGSAAAATPWRSTSTPRSSSWTYPYPPSALSHPVATTAWRACPSPTSPSSPPAGGPPSPSPSRDAVWNSTFDELLRAPRASTRLRPRVRAVRAEAQDVVLRHLIERGFFTGTREPEPEPKLQPRPTRNRRAADPSTSTIRRERDGSGAMGSQRELRQRPDASAREGKRWPRDIPYSVMALGSVVGWLQDDGPGTTRGDDGGVGEGRGAGASSRWGWEGEREGEIEHGALMRGDGRSGRATDEIAIFYPRFRTRSSSARRMLAAPARFERLTPARPSPSPPRTTVPIPARLQGSSPCFVIDATHERETEESAVDDRGDETVSGGDLALVLWSTLHSPLLWQVRVILLEKRGEAEQDDDGQAGEPPAKVVAHRAGAARDEP